MPKSTYYSGKEMKIYINIYYLWEIYFTTHKREDQILCLPTLPFATLVSFVRLSKKLQWANYLAGYFDF